MKIRGVDVVATAKAMVQEFQQDDLSGLAAEVAYRVLFSIIPFLIFLTALSGFVSRAIGQQDVIDTIMDWLTDNIPEEAAVLLEGPIESVVAEEASEFLSVGALLALWGGKGAVAALMKALNVAYNVEEHRPWLRKQIVATALTVILGLSVILGATFFLLGEHFGAAVASIFGLGATWETIWAILRWPLMLVLAIVGLAAFYWAAPNKPIPFRWLSPGALLTVLLWGVATYGLNIYFQRFAGYAEAYGLLGSVLAFIFWIWVMTVILLLGGELNAVLSRSRDPATEADLAAGPAKESDRRAAGTTDGDADAHPRPAPPMPLVPRPSIGSAVLWPSAERSARIALAAEGSAEQRRRFKRAIAALGVSIATAISAAFLGTRR